jgi:alcohol dehydrogenase
VSDFHFSVAPKIWIGPDALLRLPLLVGELGGPARSQALLIVDPLLYESKVVDRVRALLEDRGIQVLVFDEVPERASTRTADEAIRLAKGARAPLVIGFGGLKTLMVARAAAVATNSPLDLDAIVDGEEPHSARLPLVEIPTSLRHPFMTVECVALPDGRDGKARFARIPGLAPDAVLIDPALSTGLSAKLAATCVIDGLLGAVEAYVSARSSYMSDLLLEKAVFILARALDSIIARPDDPAVRADAWHGSFLASIGIGLSAPGIGAALALAINARWAVPKASLAAILLPYSMEAASKSRLEKVAALESLLGDEANPLDAQSAIQANPQESAARAVEWLRTRLGLLKIPSRLKDFDLTLDRLVEAARDARELDFMNYLPRAVSVDDVFDFVKTAF